MPQDMQRGQSWQSWGSAEWSEQDWRQGSWRDDQWQSPRSKSHPVIPTPGNFKEDEQHYDTNRVGHLPLKKHIEASAWSRAKGIAGMDIKEITLPHLCRHGLGEFGQLHKPKMKAVCNQCSNHVVDHALVFRGISPCLS